MGMIEEPRRDDGIEDRKKREMSLVCLSLLRLWCGEFPSVATAALQRAVLPKPRVTCQYHHLPLVLWILLTLNWAYLDIIS